MDFSQDYNPNAARRPVDPMANLVSKLMLARTVAHMWHWKVKSFAMHIALGELYDGLTELTDQLMEMYMGSYGTEAHIELSDPNAFSEQDPTEFIRQLHEFLKTEHSLVPQDPFIVNKFEEIQALVSTTKYKLENLR